MAWNIYSIIVARVCACARHGVWGMWSGNCTTGCGRTRALNALVAGTYAPLRNSVRRLAATFARPAVVRGPVLSPPCMRQREDSLPVWGLSAIGAWQGCPSRQQAPHRGRRRFGVTIALLTVCFRWEVDPCAWAAPSPPSPAAGHCPPSIAKMQATCNYGVFMIKVASAGTARTARVVRQAAATPRGTSFQGVEVMVGTALSPLRQPSWLVP